jgi:Ca2+-binding RTX toxin-like protein
MTTSSTTRINGSASDDRLQGTYLNEEIYGLGGNDTIYGNGGSDRLYGGDGDDKIDGGLIWNPTTGTWGADLQGDYLDGGAGNDTLSGSGRGDLMDGGTGNDKLYGDGGNDQMFGGDGDDTLFSGPAWDAYLGTIHNNNDDLLDGGNGNDTLWGGDGNDTLQGGTGDDYLDGGSGADQLFGGAGDDRLYSGGVWDPTTKLTSDDNAGDLLDGGDGDDELVGGLGNDTLLGGAGNDYLKGGAGNDLLDGGSGTNLLIGEDGDDSYVINDRFDLVYDTAGNDSGVINVDWYKPAWDVENWTWAAGVQKLPYWIDALTHNDAAVLGAEIWSAKSTVKYCFAQSVAAFFTDDDKNGFTPFTADQVAYTKKMLAYVESVINLHFVETTDAEGAYTIVFGNNHQENSSGYAREIGPGANGVVMIDIYGTSQNPSKDGGSAFFEVALHEVGHALGLKHPFGEPDADGHTGDGPYLPKSEDDAGHTVMSYTGTPVDPSQYSAFDIAALQYIYGPSAAWNAGDTRYVVGAGAATLIGDGGGSDTLDGSAQTQDMALYLAPGYWGYVGQKAASISAAGQVSIDFGTVIENALGGSGADQIIGNNVANQIDGGAGNDVLDGAGGDDKLVGGAGNDKLAGGAGNDRLEGGDGLDTAVFAGVTSGFTVAAGNGGWTVADKSGALGADTLVGVERVVFSDGAIAFDLDGIAAQAYRLYAAAFNRTPDTGGLGFWMAALDRGMSLDDVATGFTQNAEFTSMYGPTRTPESFLSTLYQNILHRAPDQGGFDFWAKAMHGGWTEGQVLALFSESTENQAQVVGQIAHGIAYLPFGTA